MRRVVTEEDVRHALFHPPEQTRAYFRGRAVAKFDSQIASLGWDAIHFGQNGTMFSVEFPHPAFDGGLDKLNSRIRDAKALEDLMS